MTSESREGYARLPEDLLRDLLDGAGDVANQVIDILGPALQAASDCETRQFRLDLFKNSKVVRYLQSLVRRRICGRAYKCGRYRSKCGCWVEGLTGETKHWDSTQYKWWTRVDRHDLETERLARGVMIAQELSVLRGAPHDVQDSRWLAL